MLEHKHISFAYNFILGNERSAFLPKNENFKHCLPFKKRKWDIKEKYMGAVGLRYNVSSQTEQIFSLAIYLDDEELPYEEKENLVDIVSHIKHFGLGYYLLMP